MEDKRIKIVKNWPELKSMKDIQVFLDYASFYWRFIQGLNKLAKPLTLILKTASIRSAENLPLSINGAEDAEVGSGTSSTTRSAENSSASVDMSEDAEVGEDDSGADKTVERSPSKKPNVPTEYFTFLRSKKIYTDV